MKRIVLVRHAKSSWEHDVTDLKRPLSNTGYNDALLMSGVFNNLNIKIDTIFSMKHYVDYSLVFCQNINFLTKNEHFIQLIFSFLLVPDEIRKDL